MSRPLGLAPLSLLGAEPAAFVRTAAAAGFDFVGLRVRPVTAAEPDLSLLPGSARLGEVRAALAETGLPVVDIEFLVLDGTVGPETWLPMLETGGELGACTLTVTAADPDRTRLADTLAALTEDGRPFGVVPALEPIFYQSVRSVPEAAALAAGAGCLWLPDSLHLRRFGGTAEELAAHAGSAPMVQLCDAPAERPADQAALVAESRASRLIPGTGGLRLHELVAAVPAMLPLSAEVPSPLRGTMGDETYAGALLAGLTNCEG
ncbi:sugar phosphate isomerase/epimerase family protein [Kocuria sp. CPCC 205263]|uniref:sugar phosphate isomerase/epimerase family protein n=1 Tax=Kocuria sp. CPCC 205263 TaxID=3073555 RepID=UPI0034D788A9